MVSFKNNSLIINLSEMIGEKLKSLKSKLWWQFGLATWLCLYFQEKWTERTDGDGNSTYFFLRRTHTFRNLEP